MKTEEIYELIQVFNPQSEAIVVIDNKKYSITGLRYLDEHIVQQDEVQFCVKELDSSEG